MLITVARCLCNIWADGLSYTYILCRHLLCSICENMCVCMHAHIFAPPVTSSGRLYEDLRQSWISSLAKDEDEDDDDDECLIHCWNIHQREAEAVSGTGHFNVRAQGSVAGSLQAPQLKMSPSVSVNLVEALLWINVLHKEKFGIFFLSLEKEVPSL